jgi:hypothetical protein
MEECLFISISTPYLRFALFEADSSGIFSLSNPRLRRCAPYLGLTMYNLFEVALINQPKFRKSRIFLHPQSYEEVLNHARV